MIGRRWVRSGRPMKKSDLDLDVAIKVMGFERFKILKVQKYSSDIGEAMKVFQKMRELGHRWMLIGGGDGFNLQRLVNEPYDLDCDKAFGTAQTLHQLAQLICEVAVEEIAK